MGHSKPQVATGDKRRGRPPVGNALSGAERSRRYREKLKREGRCPCCGQVRKEGSK